MTRIPAREGRKLKSEDEEGRRLGSALFAGLDDSPVKSRSALVMTKKGCLIALVATYFSGGCSKVLGLKEPTSSDDDGSVPDAIIADGLSAPDAPNNAKLWVFTTNAAFDGSFGLPSNGRLVADSKCNDIYTIAYMMRQCTKIHAILQVDNADDTLDHMANKFQIPSNAPVFRAIDAIQVANQWDDVVNRSVLLLQPVSTSATGVFFWSGRGMAANRQCNTWTSKDPAFVGDTGDATKISSWLSQMGVPCDSIAQHLLCVCW